MAFVTSQPQFTLAMGLGGHPQPVPAPGSACAFPWTLLSPSRLATLIVSAPHRLQSLSFIHALPVQLKELVIGMNASYSVVFFLFVHFKLPRSFGCFVVSVVM